ncbi:MAG TPA: hypothetical protein VIT43_10950 [Candidatus Dormibacteraeota bacterium]
MAGGQISIRALAASLDRPESTIRLWITDGLWVKVGERCTEADAIEAAVADYLLRKNLNRDLVRGTMHGIRQQLRKVAPGESCRVICHPQRHAGALVIGNDEAADAKVGKNASTGRSVVIFDLEPVIAAMRADFLGAMDARSPAEKTGG